MSDGPAIPDGSPPTGSKRRKRTRERWWRTRRFRWSLFGGFLLALVLVNLWFVFGQSPSRKSRRAFTQGLEAYRRDAWPEAAILFRQHLEYEPDHADAHYLLGRCLLAQGELGPAEREFAAAVRAEPEGMLANTALSELLRRRGAFREALSHARAAVARNPPQADPHVVLGRAYMAVGDAFAAIGAMRRAAEIDPDRAEVQLVLGDLYRTRFHLARDRAAEELALSRYRRAEEAARRRLAGNPLDAAERILLAKALAGQGRLEDAIREAARVAAEEPGDPEHRLLLARFHGAAGDFAKADEVLAAAIEAGVGDGAVGLVLERAKILASELGRAAEAADLLKNAIAGKPGEPGLHVALAGLLRSEGDLAGAGEVLDAALRRFPADGDLAEAVGDLRLAEGDETAAADAWRDLVERQPDRVSARKKLLKLLVADAVAAAERGEADPPARAEAEAHLAWFLDERTGLNRADPEARDLMARLLFADGDFDAAAALLGAGDGRPAAPGSYGGLKLLGLSLLRADSPDYARASELLHQALLHPDAPGSPEDHELAWTAAFRTGHHSREVEIAQRAVERWPEDVSFRMKLATSLFRDGRWGAALAECDRAREILAPRGDVSAHLLAARIHQAAGDLGKARAELEEAVTIRRDAATRGALYSFLAATGDAVLAEKGFQALVTENPTDVDALLRFGDFLLRRGDAGGAGEQYERARALDPSARDVLYRVAELAMSQAALDETKFSAARAAVDELRARLPDDPWLDYFDGKLLLLAGDAAGARERLLAYVRRNRDDPAGLYYLAIANRRTGDLKAAREGFVAAANLDPSLVEAKLELATLCFEEGLAARSADDLDAAKVAFESALAIDPTEPESRRWLAETLARLGRPEDAAREAEAVLAARPEDPGALFLAGVVAARRGDLKVAEARFGTLAAVAPDNHRSHLYLGMAIADQGRYDDAREAFREAWRLAPDSPEVLPAVVRNEVAAGRSDEALLLLAAERERRSEDPVARAEVERLAGDAHRSLGRWREAVAAWRASFELDPARTDALSLAAAAMADRGEPKEAMDLLATAAERAPRPAPLHTLRAGLLLADGRTAEAEAAFRAALAADPLFAPALRELGALLAAAGRPGEAENLLAQAVAQGPAGAEVGFRLARLAEERSDAETAIRRYREILADAPDHAAALNNLALLLLEMEGGAAEALDLATRARAAAPEDPRIADTLGQVLCRAEKFDEAFAILAPAAAAAPANAEIACRAGLAAYRAWRWDEARPLLAKALEAATLPPALAADARRALDEMR